MERYRAWHEPTPAQAKSGRYPKRLLRWRGLNLRIENEAGSVRSGVGPGGKRWETRMVYPYGYIAGSRGVDGDEVDVYVGPDLGAPMVYVVHQRRAGAWARYDEDKAMIGFASLGDARRAFLLHYNDERFLGPVTAMPADAFVSKVRATAQRPAMLKSCLLLWRLP